MILDHTPLEINAFRGIYSRDSFYDSVPRDRLLDSLNVITRGNELLTRDGFIKDITLANIRRTRYYHREGEASRALILDTNGDLYDATVSLSSPIASFGASCVDFAIVQQFNRCYISPSNGTTGLSAGFVYVYQGSGNARKAAGVRSSASFTAVISATAGNIEEGTHYFAWCFETDTGFITRPSDKDEVAVLEFDGTKAVDFSNIPTGPAGTAARRLVATKAIQNFNGDKEGYEIFFVPGGRIDDNVTTSLSAVNFFDSELIESADYLYDQLEEIPAVTFMCTYQGRICYGGESSNPSMVRISKVSEPESINEISGFILCDPSETEGVKDGVEFRNNLYITKKHHTYTTTDNTFEPSTWHVPRLDSGIGTDTNGISKFIGIGGANTDWFLAADHAGIFKFDGSYNTNLPLTYNIDEIWRRVNKHVLNKSQIIINAKHFHIYINVALDDATSPDYLLVGNYKNGMDAENIEWFLWASEAFDPVSLDVIISNLTSEPILKVAGSSGNVYSQVEDHREDDGNAINSYSYSGLAFKKSNYIHHFGAIGLKIKGSGTLAITAYTQGLTSSINLQNHTLQANPGRDFIIPMNMENEKCSIKIGVNQVGSYFKLRQLIIYTREKWATRPF